MSTTHTGEKIEQFRLAANLSLKALTDGAGVEYATLYQQIRRGTEIPFSTVDAIASYLNLPLELFSTFPANQDASLAVARQVASSAQAMVANNDPRVTGPDIASFWRRLIEVDYRLDELGDMSAHIDIYDPLEATSLVAAPESFGRLSLARTVLKICTPEDYHRRVAKFSDDIRQRAMIRHARANTEQFHFASETISEVIDGVEVAGCYLTATARGTDRAGRPKTGLLTQYVTSFTAKQEIQLPPT